MGIEKPPSGDQKNCSRKGRIRIRASKRLKAGKGAPKKKSVPSSKGGKGLPALTSLHHFADGERIQSRQRDQKKAKSKETKEGSKKSLRARAGEGISTSRRGNWTEKKGR